MPRLTSLPSRLSPLSPKLAAAPKVAEGFYTSPEWRALKADKRRLGNVFCVDCGSTRRLILDHKVERKDGGADLDIDNTEWRCTPCHNRKTAAAKAARSDGTLGPTGRVSAPPTPRERVPRRSASRPRT